MSLVQELQDYQQSVINSTSNINQNIVNAAGIVGSVLGNVNATFDNVDRFFDDDKKQMSVNNLMANIKTFARNNRFRVVIPTPPSLISLGYTSDLMRAIMVQCQAVSLPSKSLATWNYRNVGPLEKMPYDELYPDISMTFRVDSDYNTRRFFQNWLESITAKTTGGGNPGFQYKDNYVSDILILPLDLKGKPIAQFNVKRLYPINISAIQLDESTTDSITEFSVTFSYKTWQEESIGTANPDSNLGAVIGDAVDTFFDNDFLSTAAGLLGGN